MAEKIRVLIADDHAVVRRGLKVFLDLQDDIEVIAEAENGAQAVEEAKAWQPDVVVMDLVMPGMDGIRATSCVKEVCPHTQVLVLTSYADDEQLFPVLRAGASGYLMKDVAPEELAEAVRTVHRGDPLLHPDIMRRLMHQVVEARRQPEGTVTVLFTDIEGSTAIVQNLGDEGARTVFREHDCILREAVEKHGGAEVKHQGDGLMIGFPSARRAVLCAIDMQRALARRNQEQPEHAVRVRIGLNTGEVIAEEQDYFGETVILAARIKEKASGGQILVSELTRALVRGNGVTFADRGEYELKGMRGVHRLFEVRWEPA